MSDMRERVAKAIFFNMNNIMHDHEEEWRKSNQAIWLSAADATLHTKGKDEMSDCDECGRPYGDEHGFPDLIIPYEAWRQISPTGDENGLLCPSCICKKLHEKGIKCAGAFASGPIETLPYQVMLALRRVENIELAINGRDNVWSGVRKLIADNNPQEGRAMTIPDHSTPVMGEDAGARHQMEVIIKKIDEATS